MDDLHVSEAESKDDMEDKMNRSRLLYVFPTEGSCIESGFHKTVRLCLHTIRDAILHHRWQEAAQCLDIYTQTLEDTTISRQLEACEIIWRLGSAVLQHHPNSELDHFNTLYELMKNCGVKNYAKISLEHAFHLLLNGQVQNAKQQLAVALSWRYGKQSAKQSQGLRNIHAFSGFLDYLIWSTKKPSRPDAEDCGNNPMMHSYFRQASVTLQEIIKQPGVWDPFVSACIDMLEFYNDEETALQLLQNYAQNKDYPSNPNAHVYLYKYQKQHNASPDQLISTLNVLHSLVPSHELMLEYCTLLITAGKQKNLRHALRVAMSLLEYASWKTDVNAWTCLLKVLKCLRKKDLKNLIQKEWKGRQDLWLKMHFKSFHSRKDSKESPELMYVKIKVMQHFGIYMEKNSTKARDKMFTEFGKGECELDDNPRSVRVKEAEDEELQNLLDEDETQWTGDLERRLNLDHSAVLSV